MDDRD
jgi:hypothetical protein